MFLILYSCSNTTAPQEQNEPNPLIDSTFTVKCIYVLDGDTWRFSFEDSIYSVRVLSIDCFETSINDRLKSQASKAGIPEDSALALGIKAKYLADSLLTGKMVTIVRDFNEYNLDVYNRLLRICYVGEIRYDSVIKARGLDVK